MARCPSSGEKFVNFVFSPCVALFVTSDVENICSEANLSFSELLRPFSQLSKDVTIRDNNNLLHTVTSLRVNFLDTSSPLASVATARSHLRQIVTACFTDFAIPGSTYSNGKLSVCVPSTIPWFEAWRYVFIKSLRPSVHEFLGHCLASIFVVSSAHSDPVEALSTLNKQQQVQIQQQQQSSHQSSENYPCWFSTNVATFFVLVHTPAQVSQTKVDEHFAQMERVFGAANCYLLTLFTEGTKPATVTAVPHLLANGSVRPQSESDQDLGDPLFYATQTADPWLSHLLPHGYRIPVVRPDSPVPTQSDLLENTASTTDPLSAKNGVHLISTDGLGRLDQLNVDLKQCSFLSPRLYQPHGVGLSQSDLDRIRMFVYDFVVRCLIPWVEQTMRGLNEQIAHRMRLSRSFFSATKKFFSSAVGGGGSNSNTGTGSSTQLFTAAMMPPVTPESVTSSSSTPNLIGMIGSGGNMPAVSSETVMARNSTLMSEPESREDVARMLQQPPTGTTGPTVVYSPDAPEMQMRRLADLAFLFQQYEVAHQTYNVLKRDFQNDTAWIYYAGVQEMSALSIFLQGTTSQRQYPHHYVDSAVTIYLQTCHAPELALRATLLNAEALASRGLYAESAMCLLRLTSEDDDLTSALLIEQTAHYVLQQRRPLLRKFAFRMALAAHRYSRAKQPHLSIRCYRLAAPILSARGWSLIEDHINYNVGKQAYLIGDLAASSNALRQSLIRPSQQPIERQSLFVREYLVVLKKYLTNCAAQGQPAFLPDFPLPVVQLKDIKAMLGKPTRVSDDVPVESRGIRFEDDEDEDDLFKRVASMDTRSGSRCTQALFPWWMEATDVSDSESDLDESSFDDVAQAAVGMSDSSTTKTNPVLTNSRIAGHLECLLQATDPLGVDADRTRPSLRMLHNRRSLVTNQKPLVPVGETVTFQLPLSNFLQIPLALTNLHLLWTFQCDPTPIVADSTQHARLITNEPGTDGFASGPRSCQFVSTEFVPEFIMLPDENKTLEVSLVTKKMGELRITGLCFDWNFAFSSSAHYQSHQSATFSASDSHDPDRHDDPSMPLADSGALYKSSVINTPLVSTVVNRSSVNPLERSNSVRGRITLSEPVASTGTVISPLTWTVTRPAPLLRVVFSELPSKLFQGQVCRLQLFVSNVGTEPLCGVRVASNWPGCITFGSDKFASDTSTNAVYQFCRSTNDSSVLKALDDQVVFPWLDVPYQRLTDGNRSRVEPMFPGTTTSMPMWLRAPHITNPHRRHWKHRQQGNSPPLRNLAVTTGVNYSTIVQTRTVHMVFQNRSISPNSVYPVLNSRFLRHHHEMELQPSLRLEAVANPSVCSDVRDLLITLRVQNMTLKTTRSTFELVQVSCASRYWLITPISQPCPQPVSTSIGPNETVTIHLRAQTRRSPEAENSPSTYSSSNYQEDCTSVVEPSTQTSFSTVPLHSELSEQTIVQVAGSPCLDFYYRSGTHWNRCGARASRTPKVDSLGRRLDIILILIWKTPSCGLPTDSGNTFAYGQSHVAITRLGMPAVVPSDEKLTATKPRPVVSPPTSQLPPLSNLRSSLVRLRLHHAARVVHSFPINPLGRTDDTCPINLRSPLALKPRVLDVTSTLTLAKLGPKSRNCLAVIPVQAKVYNASSLPVNVRLELTDFEHKASDSPQSDLAQIEHPVLLPLLCTPSLQVTPIPCVQWVGLTLQHFSLGPGETRVLELEARVPRPGMYSFNNLLLKACLESSGPLDFVRQNTVPSSIILVDHETDTT